MICWLRIGTKSDSGGEMMSSRRRSATPSSSHTIVARTEGNTYAVRVWAVCIVQGFHFLSPHANPHRPIRAAFVSRGFGFVHHSIAILYHQVPNPNLTIRDFCIAVYRRWRASTRRRCTRWPRTARAGGCWRRRSNRAPLCRRRCNASSSWRSEPSRRACRPPPCRPRVRTRRTLVRIGADQNE